jgi:hypothetical protein
MCVYCNIADWAHEWVPGPYTPIPPTPTWPTPAPTWTREQYDQFLDILARVKDMEDKLGGCPCEDASKMDFLKTVKDQLDDSEERRLEAEACADPE